MSTINSRSLNQSFPNLRVASTSSCPSHSKHFLRRYEMLMQCVREGQIVLKHVPDVDMPADFLTKWIPSAKLDLSVVYATGAHN